MYTKFKMINFFVVKSAQYLFTLLIIQDYAFKVERFEEFRGQKVNYSININKKRDKVEKNDAIWEWEEVRGLSVKYISHQITKGSTTGSKKGNLIVSSTDVGREFINIYAQLCLNRTLQRIKARRFLKERK